MKKVFLKFVKIHSKTPVPGSATLLKKRLWHRCFPVNFVKFLRTPVFIDTSGGCFCVKTCSSSDLLYKKIELENFTKFTGK